MSGKNKVKKEVSQVLQILQHHHKKSTKPVQDLLMIYVLIAMNIGLRISMINRGVNIVSRLIPGLGAVNAN